MLRPTWRGGGGTRPAALAPETADHGQVAVTSEGTAFPAPERPFSSSPPDEALPVMTAMGGPAEEQMTGQAPPSAPHSQSPLSGPAPSAPWKRPAQNSQLLRGSCIMYGHQINPSAPCQGGIKGPGGRRTALSARRHELSRPAVGPPLRALCWRAGGAPWALCSPPLPNAPSLCFSARRGFDKCL